MSLRKKPTLKDIIGVEDSMLTCINDIIIHEKRTWSASEEEERLCEQYIYRRARQAKRQFAMLKRTQPSYWFGYTYQLLPVSSRMRVTLSQTGRLSEKTRENMWISVVAKVTLRTIKGESHRSVLIVNQGEQEDAITFYFKDVYLELLRHSVIEFRIYVVKGFFKRKYLHSHWEVPLYRTDMSRRKSDWKNINPL